MFWILIQKFNEKKKKLKYSSFFKFENNFLQHFLYNWFFFFVRKMCLDQNINMMLSYRVKPEDKKYRCWKYLYFISNGFT